MDTVQLATSAVALIIPYLAKAGEEVSKKAGEATWNRMVEMYKVIRSKFSKDNDTYAIETLNRFEEFPAIESRQTALAGIIAEKLNLNTDEAFAQELNNLIQEIAQGQEVGTFLTQVYGNANVRNLINVNSAGIMNISSNSA